MSGCCSIRAIWILNAQGAVVFSRRFPVVEKRWRTACQRENRTFESHALRPFLPTDSELAAAFAERKAREGSFRRFGIHMNQSTLGSDSWVDDPITRYIISLSVHTDGENLLLWPLVLHTKAYFYILVLPLVEPHHSRSYERLCTRSDCGNPIGGPESISSLLHDLPCITGSFLVAHAIGDIVVGDSGDPQVVASSSPSVGGLLDSLTGSIGISGISARGKPVAAGVAVSSTTASVAGAVSSDAPWSMSRPFDKDALRTFIGSSMPFGTPLDLNYVNISAIKISGFSSTDLPVAAVKQPAWKPYLYKGKQRLLFTIREAVYASMYDRDDVADSIFVSGQVNCRAELEGLPDISFPLLSLNSSQFEILSCHPCALVPEQGVDNQTLLFTPPLGNFVLLRYQSSSVLNPPVKGFYQLSMVSEDEAAFLFKLQLMDGCKAPLNMDFCTVTMPFPLRRVSFFDGNPSVGTVSSTEHSVEWKIVMGGRGISGRSVEATFPGTIRFSPLSKSRKSPSTLNLGGFAETASDDESDSSVNIEDYLTEKMNKDLQSAELEEPLCWQAYNYAKVSFKVSGGTVSGMIIDPKSVSIYPSVKAPVEFSVQVSSGEYILWNTLGRCPSVALPNV